MVRDIDEARALCGLDARCRRGPDVESAPDRFGAAPRPRRRSRRPSRPACPTSGSCSRTRRCTICCSRDVGRPLVMTSGNVSDEPIAHEDDDARARLGPMVDGILGHDRGVHIRCDDSVVRRHPHRDPGAAAVPWLCARADRVADRRTPPRARGGCRAQEHDCGGQGSARGAEPPHRRSRAPADVPLVPPGGRPLARSVRRRARDRRPRPASRVPVDEVRDRARPRTVRSATPSRARCVLHGGPRSNRASARARLRRPRVRRRTAPCGAASSSWPTSPGFERVAHLRPVTMPGGVAAIREPWRMAVAWGAGRREEARRCDGARGPGPKTTTSMGRLFDAVASMVVGRRRVSYEAQAAIELEALARGVDRRDAPVYRSTPSTTDERRARSRPRSLSAIVVERERGTPAPVVAAGFHETIGRAAAALASSLAARRELDTVVLTGGVFQNERLTEIVESELTDAGLHVLTHRLDPTERRWHQRRPSRGGRGARRGAVRLTRPPGAERSGAAAHAPADAAQASLLQRFGLTLPVSASQQRVRSSLVAHHPGDARGPEHAPRAVLPVRVGVSARGRIEHRHHGPPEPGGGGRLFRRRVRHGGPSELRRCDAHLVVQDAGHRHRQLDSCHAQHASTDCSPSASSSGDDQLVTTRCSSSQQRSSSSATTTAPTGRGNGRRRRSLSPVRGRR